VISFAILPNANPAIAARAHIGTLRRSKSHECDIIITEKPAIAEIPKTVIIFDMCSPYRLSSFHSSMLSYTSGIWAD